MELPKKIVKSTSKNPRTMIIYSQPKMGKTTALAQLDDCLILDIENGSEYVDALKINVKKEAKEQKKLPIVVLKNIMNKIKAANEEKDGYIYTRIALDTVSTLEEIAIPLANKMYKNTPMGRNWEGKSVLTLPQGAGYYYLREALNSIINDLSELCETLILLGHVKDKLVEREGKEMNERGISLTGKTGPILCAQVDAIAYFYRDEFEGRLNFKPSESLLSGTRIKHLRNKDILLSKYDPDKDTVTSNWTQVFK